MKTTELSEKKRPCEWNLLELDIIPKSKLVDLVELPEEKAPHFECCDYTVNQDLEFTFKHNTIIDLYILYISKSIYRTKNVSVD
jgi:hypothetical protein